MTQGFRTAACTLPLFLAAAAIASPTFRGLNQTNSFSWSIALDVSADGSTVLGVADNSYRLWAPAGVPLDTAVVGGQEAFGHLSGDGSTVVGTSYVSGPPRPFRWTSGGGFQLLGTANGEATAVNADGSVVVGTRNGGVGPFIWTTATGVNTLWSGGVPRGLSANGTVVVGTGPNLRATIWTSAGGFHDLPPSGFSSDGVAMSTDGAIVVGNVHYAANVSARWINGVLTDPGLLPGMNQSVVKDVSGDGLIMVGLNYNSNTQASKPFLWSPSTGLVELRTFLTGKGINLTQWTIRSVEAISPDGRTIVGTGLNNGILDGWVAVVPLGCYADVGAQGGIPGHDGQLDNNDFVIFIGYFFTQDPRADVGAQGGIPGHDGFFDNNEYVVLIG